MSNDKKLKSLLRDKKVFKSIFIFQNLKKSGSGVRIRKFWLKIMSWVVENWTPCITLLFLLYGFCSSIVSKKSYLI